ncbi:MAG: choline/carnitine O-acyltransferase, partial [archaeon]|nr:choline/carnitine O-acyltransferase [archaeon]
MSLRNSITKLVSLIVLLAVTTAVSIIGVVSSMVGQRLESLVGIRVVSVHEALLRFLLRQRHWLYDQTSLVTQLFFGVVRALSVRRPGTFEFRRVLPRLPVPDLRDTCSRYLDSVRPQLTFAEYANTQRVVREFMRRSGPGPVLQRLLQRRAAEVDNWVSDLWHTHHYLRDRQPLPINSNWYGNDYPNPPTTWNVKRAANWIVAALRFKQLLDNGAITPIRLFDAVPIDMSHYDIIFGSARVPGETRDSLSHRHDSRHICLVYKHQWYQIEVIDANQEPYNLREIVAQIQSTLHRCDTAHAASPFPPLGVLTTDHRTVWARNRKHLAGLSTQNQQSLRSIETSLFVLCMDDHVVLDLTDQARTMFHGDGRNRWFDKSFQLITTANAVTCVNGEHSSCDAPIIAYLNEFAVVHEQKTTDAVLNQPRRSGFPVNPPVRLLWNIDPFLLQAIENSSTRIDQAIRDVDLIVLRFKFFGKGFIKESQMSPDSFVQIALQLAYYRLHHQNPHTYETAQTRLFLAGRTETVRSCTSDSSAFTKSMDDARVSIRTKYDLLTSAIRTHATAMRNAMSGAGCDRHLFALQVLAETHCETLPEIFSDKGYNLPWKMTTSQNAVRMGSGGGFGPVDPAGYGIAYLPHEQELFFHITAFRSCPDTSCLQLSRAIERALLDMQSLCFGQEPASARTDQLLD